MNSLIKYMHHKNETMPVILFLNFPMGIFSCGNIFPFWQMGKKSHGIFSFFSKCCLCKKNQENEFTDPIYESQNINYVCYSTSKSSRGIFFLWDFFPISANGKKFPQDFV